MARLEKRIMARHAGFSYYIMYCYHLMFKFGLLLNFVAHSSQGRDIHWLQTWVGDSYQWLNGLGLNNRFNSLVLALNQTSFIWKHTVFDFIGSELMLRKNPNHLDRHFGKGRFKILSMGKIFFYSLVGCNVFATRRLGICVESSSIFQTLIHVNKINFLLQCPNHVRISGLWSGSGLFESLQSAFYK